MLLRLIKRDTLYRGRVFTIVVDELEYPSGGRTIREVAQPAGGAAVLAVFPDETIILVRQHRYPVDRFIWELPAGKLNQHDAILEDPLGCAKRELEEETGYTASRWTAITSMYTTPGFCTEVLHLYLAQDLSKHPDGRRLEEGEETMTLHILPLSEVKTMIDRGEIVDGKTICGILLGERLLRKVKP